MLPTIQTIKTRQIVRKRFKVIPKYHEKPDWFLRVCAAWLGSLLGIVAAIG